MTISKKNPRTKSQNNTHISPPPIPSFIDRSGGISSTLSANRWVSYLFIMLLVVLSFLYFPSWGGGDYDMWWHFSLGKHYLTHQTMTVDHSLFSWTPAYSDWHYNTWLGSTMVYLIYEAGGGFGLWLFQWIIFTAIFLFFLYFVRSIQGRLDLNAMALVFMAVIVEGLSLVFPKPELFTPLFFMALVSIFFAVKRNRISPKFFYLYPVMFAFWVNLHGGYIMGLGIVAIWFVTEWLNRFWAKGNSISSPGLFHMGCSLALTGLACLINPYGWAYPWDTITVTFPVFQQISGGRELFGASLIAYIPLWPFLWQPEKLNWFAAGWVMVCLLMLFFIVSWSAFRRKRFFDISLLFVNLFLFYFGMITVRACVFFPAFAFFSIYYTMEKADLLLRAKRFTLVSMILFLCLGSVVMIKLTETAAFNFFGANLQETVPVKEVEMIKKLKLPPPLFNDYVSGGYMMWAMYPEYKVFIDSRGKPYDITHVWDDYKELMEKPTRANIRKITARYPFRVALINLVYTDTILQILEEAGDEWVLLFFDRNAAILAHRSILPGLDKEVLRSLNMDPSRFSDVKSPETLSNLFLIYVGWTSRYGAAIRDIYSQNVSNCYRHKDQQLAAMAEILNEKRAMEKGGLPFQK
jgi:hypothetical protein